MKTVLKKENLCGGLISPPNFHTTQVYSNYNCVVLGKKEINGIN